MTQITNIVKAQLEKSEPDQWFYATRDLAEQLKPYLGSMNLRTLWDFPLLRKDGDLTSLPRSISLRSTTMTRSNIQSLRALFHTSVTCKKHGDNINGSFSSLYTEESLPFCGLSRQGWILIRLRYRRFVSGPRYNEEDPLSLTVEQVEFGNMLACTGHTAHEIWCFLVEDVSRWAGKRRKLAKEAADFEAELKVLTQLLR